MMSISAWRLIFLDSLVPADGSPGIARRCRCAKDDVPWGATSETEWRLTRLSRRRVYWPTRPERAALHDSGKLGYRYNSDPTAPSRTAMFMPC